MNGYDGLYQVSNLGRVKSFKCGKEKILKPRKTKKGYLHVGLSCKSKMKNMVVHRLVANAFLGESQLTINHIDKNKENNKLENLEYMTNADNIRYSQAKKVLQFDLNNNFIKEWKCISEAKRTLKILHIIECCQNKIKTAGGYIWKYKDTNN